MAVLLEALGEVALGRKARGLGYFADAVIGGGQQLFAGLYPYTAQIIDRRTAEIFHKGMYQIVLIQV